MNVLNYAAAAGLTAMILYLMVVGNAILLPLVIAVFVCYLINALAAVTRDIRIRGWRLPNSLRLAGAIVVLLLGSWFVLTLVVRNIHQVTAAVPVYQKNLELGISVPKQDYIDRDCRMGVFITIRPFVSGNRIRIVCHGRPGI